jgi:hypothetical protein
MLKWMTLWTTVNIYDCDLTKQTIPSEGDMRTKDPISKSLVQG